MIFWQKKKVLLRICLLWGCLLLSLSLAAQTVQDTSESNPDAFIPWVPAEMPLKRIRAIVHVVGGPNGEHNLRAEVPEEMAFVKRVLSEVNWRYRDPARPRYPVPTPYLHDTRIRFVWDTILFHQHPTDWDFTNENLSYRMRKLDTLYQRYVTENPAVQHKSDAIQVFWVEGKRLIGHGIASGIGNGKWNVLINTHTFFQDTTPAGQRNTWGPAGTMRHELAHNLGLTHTCAGKNNSPMNDGCDDTNPHNREDYCCKPRFRDSCTTNIMAYASGMKSFTAEQIGKMHWFLSGMRGNVHRAVIPDWQTWSPDTLRIGTGFPRHWWGRRRLTGDLLLEPGAELHLHALLTLPPGGKIILEQGAQLVVHPGGRIACGDTTRLWKAIEYHGSVPLFGAFTPLMLYKADGISEGPEYLTRISDSGRRERFPLAEFVRPALSE